MKFLKMFTNLTEIDPATVEFWDKARERTGSSYLRYVQTTKDENPGYKDFFYEVDEIPEADIAQYDKEKPDLMNKTGLTLNKEGILPTRRGFPVDQIKSYQSADEACIIHNPFYHKPELVEAALKAQEEEHSNTPGL